jgi:cytochrome c oxidase assembly factor CtaG
MAHFSGLPELTIGRTVTAWTVDVPALLLIALLGGLYLFGVRRYPGRWPGGRTAYFVGGLAVLLVCTCGFLGVYENTLFWVRATQTVLLMMIVPFLFALAAPITLTMATAPTGVAHVLRRTGRSAFARALTFPLVITVVLVAPPLVLYLTPVYSTVLTVPAVDMLMRIVLLCTGFCYFWSRIQLDPTPRNDTHAVSLWISLAEVVFDGVLGLVIWLGPLLAPAHYAAVDRHWGPDVRLDQDIGAGVIWVGGDLAGLPFLGAMMGRWRRADESRAREIDRELDAARDPDEPSDTGLWWEDDPTMAQRFRQR